MRFINEFSKETLSKIGYYVYLYSDPDTKEPFYVGKGKGNRVFNHLKVNELYDVTRGIWAVDINRAKTMKYAFAVYYGLVVEVYSIATWFPAGTTYSYRIDKVEGKFAKRYEFVGNIAPEEIRNKYINKNVSSLFKSGNQNPIMYIEKT